MRGSGCWLRRSKLAQLFRGVSAPVPPFRSWRNLKIFFIMKLLGNSWMIDDFISKSISKCFSGTLFVIFEACLELVPSKISQVVFLCFKTWSHRFKIFMVMFRIQGRTRVDPGSLQGWSRVDPRSIQGRFGVDPGSRSHFGSSSCLV